MKFVAFNVFTQKYAIEIEKVQEVMVMPKYLEVPHTHEFIEGVVDLRGEIIPVISLRKRFGIEEDNKEGKKYLIVLDLGGKKFGLKVDGIEGVIDATPNDISSSDEIGEINKEYVSQVIRKLNDIYICINPEKVVEVSK